MRQFVQQKNMLRKSTVSFLKISSIKQTKNGAIFRSENMSLKDVYFSKDKIGQCMILGSKCMAKFGSLKKDNSLNKQIKNKDQNSPKIQVQDQQPQTIEVSLQQFQKMKNLLNQLKQQISELQNQEQNKSKPEYKNTKIQSSSVRQKSRKISQEISEFISMPQFAQLSKNKIDQQENLFFKSDQQKLSFKLIKLNVKEQFKEVIKEYLTKLKQQERKMPLNKQNLTSKLKLLYLIFYRYSLIENAKFYDSDIQILLIKIAEYINLFDEGQVEKIMTILSDQIKIYQQESESTKNIHYLRNQKQNSNKNKNIEHFITKLKQQLLKNNNVFNFQQKTFRNSEILSLFQHFFQQEFQNQLYFLSQLNLQKTSQDNKHRIIYNPLNLNHVLIKLIKKQINGNQTLKIFEIFIESLQITQKEFQNLQRGEQKFQLQSSLLTSSYRKFNILRFQGIVFFIENYPNIEQKYFWEQFWSKTQANGEQRWQLYTSVQKLRICLSFLVRSQSQQLNPQYFESLTSSIKNILIQNKGNDILIFQKSSLQSLESNYQFLHLKKLSMILSQLGIQIFKNYRLILSQNINDVTKNNIKEIIQVIISLLNKICLQRLDVKDLFKQQQSQKERDEDLILDLSLFQFSVNLNLLFRFSSQLGNENLQKEQNAELMKNLIVKFFTITKNHLSKENILSEDQKITLSEQIIIQILIGKQNSLILQSLKILFNQQDYKYYIFNLLQTTIGQNQKHKYYTHYQKIKQQFNL